MLTRRFRRGQEADTGREKTVAQDGFSATIDAPVPAVSPRPWHDDTTPFTPISEETLRQMGYGSPAAPAAKAPAAPQAQPPVCKIMDYGKYKFEAAKREKENRKNQKVIEIKEVRLSPTIDTHDFETKINHARKFIGSGDKVKVSIRFRGREMAHPELGLTIMSRCAEALADCAAVEKPAKLEGRQMLMFMAPKSSK